MSYGRNELDGFALTADEKMAGNAQGVDNAEERMLVRVDLVGKQFSTAPVLYSKGGREILWRTTNETFSSGSRGLKIGRMSLACIQPTAVLPSVF